MRWVAFVLGTLLLLTACAVPLTQEQRAAYQRLGLVFLVKGQIMFTDQGPLPIMISQKTEDVPDWSLREDLEQTALEALGHDFDAFVLHYPDATFISAFEDNRGGWPGPSSGQKEMLRDLAAGERIDAIVLIQGGSLALGEVAGHIKGAGLIRSNFLGLVSVATHALLQGHIIDGATFSTVAHTEVNNVRRFFEKTAWGYGFSEMSDDARKTLQDMIRSSQREVLGDTLSDLGLIQD